MTGGNAIMPEVNKIRAQTPKGYWTQDWHPVGHCSLASTHGRQPFTKVWMKEGQIVGEYAEDQTENDAPIKGAIIQMLWTDHGVQDTEDAQMHPDLIIPAGDLILQKGKNPLVDSYSCVWENDRITRPRFDNGETLPDQLRTDGIDTVIVSGLALDVCVADSAVHLKEEGFRVIVVLSACAAITPEGKAATLKRFADAGVEVVEKPENLVAYLAAKPSAPSLEI
ncbi:MAG: isochorismatase family protein [Alphaproteobacteria bacterium]|nr:isochorismatase family protein [Alphaproteobacteria bacterium]